MLAAAFGIRLDMDGDRGATDPGDFRITADQVADEHRLMELKGIDRDGDDAALRATSCDNAAGDVDLGHDPAAEDVTGGVGIGGPGHDADGQVPVVRQ